MTVGHPGEDGKQVARYEKLRPFTFAGEHKAFGPGESSILLGTIGDAIVRLNKERGYTFCVIEHDMDFIGRLCDPVICMAEGKVLAQGTLDEIKANEQVIEAYLGKEEEEENNA